MVAVTARTASTPFSFSASTAAAAPTPSPALSTLAFSSLARLGAFAFTRFTLTGFAL